MKKILVVTGEESGDMHAAALVNSLKDLKPNIKFYAVGGNYLKNAGAQIVGESSLISVVGFLEALKVVPKAFSLVNKIRILCISQRFDLVILVDSPGFNLRIAKVIKEFDIPVVYYIAPQLWAWNENRAKILKEYVDFLIVILPFEKEFFQSLAIEVFYTGNPLVDKIDFVSQPKFSPPFNLLLLPGSRRDEINNHLPIMLDALKLLEIPVEATIVMAKKEAEYADLRSLDIPIVYRDNAREAFKNAHLAICASGTVTLELGLAAIPMVVVYKLARLTYLLASRVVKVKWISLVNLVFQEEVVPELIQDKFNPVNLSRTIEQLLAIEKLHATREKLFALKRMLGPPRVSERVARSIIQRFLE